METGLKKYGEEWYKEFESLKNQYGNNLVLVEVPHPHKAEEVVVVFLVIPDETLVYAILQADDEKRENLVWENMVLGKSAHYRNGYDTEESVLGCAFDLVLAATKPNYETRYLGDSSFEVILPSGSYTVKRPSRKTMNDYNLYIKTASLREVSRKLVQDCCSVEEYKKVWFSEDSSHRFAVIHAIKSKFPKDSHVRLKNG